MKRFCGFNCQQYGDLVINTVVAKSLKQANLDSHLCFVIANDYKDCADLFLHHPYIDEIKVLHKGKDGFDDEDKQWVKEQKFDNVFDPMKGHGNEIHWYKNNHQTNEICRIHGLQKLEDHQCILNNYFKDEPYYDNVIAFHPFPGYYNKDSHKALKIIKAQSIVNDMVKMDYKVLQLGGPTEPKLENTMKFPATFSESIRYMLRCKMLIGGDSGINWAASAYSFPVLGLYSRQFYGATHLKNIQPVNPHSIYLDSEHINDIPNELIVEKIKTILS